MSHTTQAKREAQAADETEAHPCQLDGDARSQAAEELIEMIHSYLT
jgi:hypothetical protein